MNLSHTRLRVRYDYRMTATQIGGALLLLTVGIVLLLTVGPNPAVVVAFGVAVVLYVTTFARQRS